jgi:valyl-tRNA synthetase
VTAQVDQDLERFELAKACETLYHFAWDEFCDWYLELAKVPLGGAHASGDPASAGAAAGREAGPASLPDPADAAAETTRDVLGFVLDCLLKLLHPIMPFLTDELWTALPGTTQTGVESVMVAPWPGPSISDAGAEAEMASVMRLVTEVRRFRSDQGLRPGQRVAARLPGIEASPAAGHEERIRFLLRLIPPDAGFTPSAAIEAEGVTVELDTAGVIDVPAERRRMEKDLAAAAKEAGQARAKLANAGFTAKAPAEVVEKTRQRLAAAQQDISRISDRLARLPG